jgi:TRAP-type uncharacterized transport system fused permease subunit
MTGIGVKFTRIVFDLSGGHLFLMLILIMLACIVMGMGLPATAAFVIAATIGVPPLINAGITTISANMFVLYFAIISFITPPIAIAAYAAAGLSGANAMKTGFRAFLLGLSGFIIPFVYAYNPALLILNSSPWSIIYITVLVTFAIYLLSAAIVGWLSGKLNWLFRILLIVSAILIFIQGNKLYDLIGVSMGIALLVIIYLFNKRKDKINQTPAS